MSLVLNPLVEIPLIFPGDDLAAIITDALDKNRIRLEDGDILVLAQKIVSKSEDRLVNLNDVTPSPRAQELALITHKDARFVELVLSESNTVLRAQTGTLIVEHHCGFVCANAGIDHSNVEGAWGKPEDWVLLLPENPDRSAATIRQRLEASSGVKLGVSIIDSHGRAWRNGIVGTSIGFSGLPGLVDMRGKPDLYGYELRITTIAAADELAAAASLMMGQADEKTPVVHVRGFPYSLRESSLAELIRPKEQDLFR
jgi:coenzyme F420-0:L-glutamate ligase/coenzyme F420-1:gamma-L-glutamate ligase